MQARGFWTLGDVSDGELQGRLKELLRSNSHTEARIVAHLAEVDARRLHLLGAPSLFKYCLVELGFSESEAWYRICAARAGRKFPFVFELLEQRELHLTAIALLSKFLTEENHRELLNDARGRTKQQILELLARRWPKANVSSHLRRIPAGAVAAGPTGTLEPRSAETYCLQLNATHELKAKLEQARDLMSHANPNGDLAVVVERALELLIQKLKARRFGQTGTLRAPRPHETGDVSHAGETSDLETSCAGETSELGTSGAGETSELEARRIELADSSGAPSPSTGGATWPAALSVAVGPRKRRHIRHDVRRQVIERDGESCSHMSPDGRRCEARAFLQLHHEQAWALGGADSFGNLRVLCRAHNRFIAERELGAERVAEAIERRRKQA